MPRTPSNQPFFCPQFSIGTRIILCLSRQLLNWCRMEKWVVVYVNLAKNSDCLSLLTFPFGCKARMDVARRAKCSVIRHIQQVSWCFSKQSKHSHDCPQQKARMPSNWLFHDWTQRANHCTIFTLPFGSVATKHSRQFWPVPLMCVKFTCRRIKFSTDRKKEVEIIRWSLRYNTVNCSEHTGIAFDQHWPSVQRTCPIPIAGSRIVYAFYCNFPRIPTGFVSSTKPTTKIWWPVMQMCALRTRKVRAKRNQKNAIKSAFLPNTLTCQRCAFCCHTNWIFLINWFSFFKFLRFGDWRVLAFAVDSEDMGKSSSSRFQTIIRVQDYS